MRKSIIPQQTPCSSLYLYLLLCVYTPHRCICMHIIKASFLKMRINHTHAYTNIHRGMYTYAHLHSHSKKYHFKSCIKSERHMTYNFQWWPRKIPYAPLKWKDRPSNRKIKKNQCFQSSYNIPLATEILSKQINIKDFPLTILISKQALQLSQLLHTKALKINIYNSFFKKREFAPACLFLPQGLNREENDISCQ